MKSFKKFVAEVAQPKPEEEKRFKDQHTYEVQPHPVALDHQFTGEIAGKTKQPRAADNVAGQDADLKKYQLTQQMRATKLVVRVHLCQERLQTLEKDTKKIVRKELKTF
jgi:hypothetical protein